MVALLPASKEFSAQEIDQSFSTYLKEGLNATSIGIRLDAKSGINIISQSHLDQKKRFAKTMAKVTNTDKPLINDLPTNQQYFMIAGTKSPPEYLAFASSLFIESLKFSAAGNKEIPTEVIELLSEVFTIGIESTASTSGFVWQPDTQLAGLVSSLQYDSVKRRMKSMPSFLHLNLMLRRKTQRPINLHTKVLFLRKSSHT